MNNFEWFRDLQKRARLVGIMIEPLTLREAEIFAGLKPMEYFPWP